MANDYLTNPEFWENVEAGEVIAEITRLEQITEPTKGERKKLNAYRTRLVMVRREAEQLAALNKKWQSGKDEPKHNKVPLSPEMIAKFFPTPLPVREPGKLYCTFCDCKVDQINATFGTGEVKVQKYLEVVGIGEDIHQIEKLRATSEKMVACPNCVRLIPKPKVTTTV